MSCNAWQLSTTYEWVDVLAWYLFIDYWWAHANSTPSVQSSTAVRISPVYVLHIESTAHLEDICICLSWWLWHIQEYALSRLWCLYMRFLFIFKCTMSKKAQSQRNLEASVLHLSWDWGSTYDKVVNVSVLWVQKKFQQESSWKKNVTFHKKEKNRNKMSTSDCISRKETILYSCQAAITCTITQANPWEYFHNSNLQ